MTAAAPHHPDPGRKRVAEVRALLARPSGTVHMVGVGGVGMAGVAVQLVARGFRVTGCDLAPGRVAEWLGARDVRVEEGHDGAHIARDVTWVVHTAAVPPENPELKLAAARGVPVFPRGVVLPALLDGRRSIAVSGTHGKTTTSAMIAQILAACGLAPGFCVGGEVDALGGVGGVGDGHILVVEADESDGTVALYEPDVAVVTNIEFDHMEHFRSEEEMIGCFRAFARGAGRVVYGADDPQAAAVAGGFDGAVSYGFRPGADVRGTSLDEGPGSVSFDLVLRGRVAGRISVPAPGRHNAANALGAAAAALAWDVPFEGVREALAGFVPVRRRFERVCDGGGVVVISDYAHHPTEIRALVASALGLGRKRVLAVFQPHRYTRTRALGAEFPAAFEGVDELVLVPVYAASETPLEGGTSEDLLRRFQSSARVAVRYSDSLEGAWAHLRAQAEPGDLVLVIGAGDVEKVAWWARDEWAGEKGGS